MSIKEKLFKFLFPSEWNELDLLRWMRSSYEQAIENDNDKEKLYEKAIMDLKEKNGYLDKIKNLEAENAILKQYYNEAEPTTSEIRERVNLQLMALMFSSIQFARQPYRYSYYPFIDPNGKIML